MKQLAEKPFALIGVNGNNYEPKKLKQVMDKEKLNWRSFTDRSAITAKWAARGTPTYYIIDHKGVIRYKWIGYPGATALDSALERVLMGARPPSRPRPRSR